MAGRGLRFVSLGLVAALLLETTAEANVPGPSYCVNDREECNRKCVDWRTQLPNQCMSCGPSLGGGWACPFTTPVASSEVVKATPAPRVIRKVDSLGGLCVKDLEECNNHCMDYMTNKPNQCVPCPTILGGEGYMCPLLQEPSSTADAPVSRVIRKVDSLGGLCVKDLEECNNHCMDYMTNKPNQCVPCPTILGGEGYMCPLLQEPSSTADAPVSRGFPCVKPILKTLCDKTCNKYYNEDCAPCTEPGKLGWWTCPMTAAPAVVKAAPSTPHGFPDSPCVKEQEMCNWGCRTVYQKNCIACPFAAGEWLCLP